MHLKTKSGVATLTALMVSSSLLMTAAFAGPQKKSPKKPAKPPVKGGAKKDDPAKAIAAGKKIYADNGCSACHAIGGEGGKTGPALDEIGKEHDAKWITEFVKNPKSKHPDSTMPAYEETIKGKDMDHLGAYLASLKGKK